MKVQIIALTEFVQPDGIPWEPKLLDEDGSALVEFAGRACYQSWTRPNPATATNRGYIAHLIEVGHLSVLEHASVTFYIEGVSRSLTHELVRHRHFSYSQLSQRYVDETDRTMVDGIEPDVIANNPEAHTQFQMAMEQADIAYAKIAGILESSGKFTRKQVRQAARAVLPNATETKIVVTGNYRAWRHFIDLRATPAADVEIRALAVECLVQLKNVAYNVFADYSIIDHSDGTMIAERKTG